MVFDQKISDRLIKIMFLGENETTVRLVLNLGLESWALSVSDIILGL